MRVEPPDGWRNLVLTAVDRTLGPDIVIDDMTPVWVPRIATTLGVYRAAGHATLDGTTRPIDVIVKCVAQPLDGPAPEATFYTSAAPAGLPTGLLTPRCFDIIDLHDRTTAIVLDHVQDRFTGDAEARIVRIAQLLGQLAGSSESAFATYAATRPRRRLLAPVDAIGDLLDRIATLQPNANLGAAFPPVVIGRLDETRANALAFAVELDRLPALACHGDANPRNFLANGDRIVAIDWVNAGTAPVGHDLAVLVYYAFALFDLDVERFAEIERRLLDAHIDGLHAGGCDVERDDVHRGYTIQLGAGVALLESLHTLRMITGALDRESVEARYGVPLPAILARRAELLAHALHNIYP